MVKKRRPRVEVLPPEEVGPDNDTQNSEEILDSEEEEVDLPLSHEEDATDLVPSSGLPGVVETAISPTDPLRRYLSEIQRHPLLEPEEEYVLVKEYREKGDLTAAKRLVQANLRLVVKIAFEYRTFYQNLMDLVQEGNIGLMKAVSKFDPTKGARLGYYASWWIRSYILKYLLDNFRLVKIGTTQAQKKLFYQLMREKERLEAQGLAAGPKLLAEKLEVREKDVVEMQQRLSGAGAEVSLDAPMDTDSGTRSTFVDLLRDPSENPDETLAREQGLDILKQALPEFSKGLGEREIIILNERILSENPKTLQEVADLYGLTRERVRQVESKLIEKLRNFLKNRLS